HGQALHVGQDDHGAVMGRELFERRIQRGPKLGLHGRVAGARRPVADRLSMTPVLVEGGKDLVQRDVVAPARAAAKLLVGGVGGDPVDPRSQRRIPPERVDLADHVPERVLDGFLGIRKIEDRKSTRLNSSHVAISYAVFCLKKKKKNISTISYGNKRN